MYLPPGHPLDKICISEGSMARRSSPPLPQVCDSFSPHSQACTRTARNKRDRDRLLSNHFTPFRTCKLSTILEARYGTYRRRPVTHSGGHRDLATQGQSSFEGDRQVVLPFSAPWQMQNRHGTNQKEFLARVAQSAHIDMGQ